MTKNNEIRSAITLESDGFKLFGILHMPREAMQVGCVLFIHGFGGHKVGKYRLAVRQAEQLSKRGIASFRFDLRGSGDSEGDFRDITVEGMLKDVATAIEYVRNHPQIDENKIVLCGRSMGGALACLAAQKYHPKAFVLWAPVFDAEPWVTGKATHRALVKDDEGVSFSGNRLNATCLQEFASLSVQNSLDALQTLPMCIIQGQKDQTLDMYHYNKYLAKRKSATGDTKAILLPSSGHDFDNVQEQQLVLNTTTDWIAKCVH